MAGYERVVYWDSCIWLAWLKKETWPQEDWDGMLEVAQMVMADKWVILGSAIVHTEVLRGQLPADVAKNFNAILHRRNVVFRDVDERISTLAGDIREFYVAQHAQDGLGVVESMDAIHLATAIHYRANVFQTFDDGGKGGRSLLSLGRSVATYRLVVSRPRAQQGMLPLSS